MSWRETLIEKLQKGKKLIAQFEADKAKKEIPPPQFSPNPLRTEMAGGQRSLSELLKGTTPSPPLTSDRITPKVPFTLAANLTEFKKPELYSSEEEYRRWNPPYPEAPSLKTRIGQVGEAAIGVSETVFSNPWAQIAFVPIMLAMGKPADIDWKAYPKALVMNELRPLANLWGKTVEKYRGAGYAQIEKLWFDSGFFKSIPDDALGSQLAKDLQGAHFYWTTGKYANANKLVIDALDRAVMRGGAEARYAKSLGGALEASMRAKGWKPPMPAGTAPAPQPAEVTKVPVFVPRGTQTGAMAFGGLTPKQSLMPSMKWTVMLVKDKVKLAVDAGLEGKVGYKAWDALTPEERQVISSKLKAEVTPGGTAVPGQTRTLADIMAGARAELVAKEPWQMSKAEYDKYIEVLQRTQSRGLTEKLTIRMAKASDELSRIQGGRTHKWQIEQALAAGKPVPAEVLKDYPDLAAKVVPAATEVTKSLEYQVTISGDQTIKTPRTGFGFKVENDYNKLQQLGDLAPKTQYDATNNRLIQETIKGRFATQDELVQVRKLIEDKGLTPRGLLSEDVIVTPEGKFKVVDVGNFELALPKAEVVTPEVKPLSVKEAIPAKVAPAAPEGTFKVLGRTSSGEANLVQSPEGVLLERIATGKQRGWWKTIVGDTEVVAKTRERVIEIAQKRGLILPEAKAITPEVTIPTTEAGMPEAGYQPAMIEGVTEKEVRPAGKGKITQISMEEQLKLEQARQAALPEEVISARGITGQKGIDAAIQEAQATAKTLKSKKTSPYGVDEFDEAIAEIGTELGLRSMPYHGGAKAGAYQGYTTKQLDAMIKVYQTEKARIKELEHIIATAEVPTAPPTAAKLAEVETAKPIQEAAGIPPSEPPPEKAIGKGDIPSPQIRPFRGVVINSVPELELKAWKQTIQGVEGRIVSLPGVRRIGRLNSPIAMSNDPVTTLRTMSGIIDDQKRGGASHLMDRVISTQARLRLFQFDKSGISRTKDITQISSLPGDIQSKVGHDIVEYVDRYDFGKGEAGERRKEFIKTVRETSEQASNMLRNEDILVDTAPKPGQIKALKGESDWAYLHRVVITVKEEAADTLSNKLNAVLTQEGIPFAKQVGESTYGYVKRFAEEIADGHISPTEKINTLLDDFANLADVKVKKKALEAKRSWVTTTEGMKAGLGYEPNILRELQKQVNASYELVKKKRLAEAVKDLLQTTTPEEEVSKELGKSYSSIAEQENKSGTLVDYLHRVNRGEALPGASLEVIRREYPDIARRLDEATAILPKNREILIKKITSAIIREGGITQAEATNLAREIKESLTSLKHPLTAKGLVTIKDISGVLSPILKTKRLNTIAVRQIYLNLSTQQKGTLKTLLGEAKTLNQVDKQALKTADTLKAKYTERMGPLGTVEYGRLPGMPGLGNRVLQSQAGMTGQEVADSLRNYFGYMPKHGADVAVEVAGKLGALMRMGRLGFDLSMELIQQALSLGFDIRNMLILKPTAVWAKSTGGVLRTLVSRDMNHLEKFVVNNEPLVKDFIERQGLYEGSEFTEAATPVSKALKKLPARFKLDKIGAFIGRHIFERSDIVFTTGRLEAAINIYKAAYVGAKNSGNLDELAKTANLMTGVLSTRGMGVSEGQRSIESAFGLLAPRFTRANASILYHIFFRPRSYTAKQAASSLVALILATTAVYLAAKKVQDEEANLNPFDPDSLKVESGGQKYYLGGILADLRRVLQVIDTMTYMATGERISLSGRGDNTPRLDVLLFRQAQSKTAPVTGTAIDIVRMMTDKQARDWQGRPLTWRNIISNWITPSAYEPLISEGSIPGTLASLVGISTTPIDKPYELSQEWKNDFVSYNAIPSNDLDFKAALRDGTARYSREQYRQRYPEVDAKLFIVGDVSTIKTSAAYSLVLKLVGENKINSSDISAVQEWQKAEQKRKDLGLRDTNITLTDRLILQLLSLGTSKTPAKTPASIPAPSFAPAKTPSSIPAAPRNLDFLKGK